MENQIQLPNLMYLHKVGTIYDTGSKPLCRLQPEQVTKLFSGEMTSVVLQDRTYSVKPLSNELLQLSLTTGTTSKEPDKPSASSTKILLDYLAKYDMLDIDSKTGEISTNKAVNIGTLPDDILRCLIKNGKSMTINGQQVFLNNQNGHLVLRAKPCSLSSIDELITFGLENNVNSLVISNSTNRYKIGDKLYDLDRVYTEPEIQSMLKKYDPAILSVLELNKGYHTTRIVEHMSINMHVIQDSVYTLIFDFIQVDKHVVTDFYDEEWLQFVKSYNVSEQGGIVVVSEKPDVPEILLLLIDAISESTDNIVSYGKTLESQKVSIMNFSNQVKLNELASVDMDICVLDFMEATKDWDTIFQMVDNKTVVLLVVRENSLYMTLSMLTETFPKQYLYRKFIETLLGINIVKLSHTANSDRYEVNFDYVYNNSQFKTLLGSKVFNKFELQDRKFKHYYFSINGTRKDTESTLKDILVHANEIGAHDIALVAGYPPGFRKGRDMVRTLTDAKLQPYMTESMFMAIVKDQRLREQLKEIRGDGIAVSYSVPGVGRYRVNVYNQRGSISISMRKIPDSIPDMDWCGIPKQIQELINSAKQGLILVTGPTGMGKSTSLASAINYRNMNRAEHIITIEDPIEYLYPSGLSYLEQIELGTDTKSFVKSMKSNMRNNPDVIEIGEIRDPEVLAVSLDGAVTGHLVLSTLHTKGALETLQRCIEMTPAENRENIKSLLAQNLIATITQQLLPSTDGGMVAALEIMVVNTAIRSCIVDGTPNSLQAIPSHLMSGTAEGMQDMDRAIALLLKQERITRETAENYCKNFQRVLSIFNTL